ncbi:MAG: NAD(P)H-dependent oxidoreductase [Ilumatobacteraceae bacterium]
MDVLMVTAHPHADSFTAAVATAARRGMQRAGHSIVELDLYAIGFAPTMSPAERAAYHQATPLIDPMTIEHGRLVRQATALVFVYPTWWGGPPAVLRGWLERVLVPGVAFRFDERGKVVPGMTNVRRIVGISTYGSPRRYVRLMSDGGRRALLRALRMNCGWRASTRWVAMYSTDNSTATQRADFLERVERSTARLGRWR